MGIVRYTAGRERTPEELAARKARIEAAAKRRYTYDPDSPMLTEEQLAEFRPVNYATNEERLAAMGLQTDERSLDEAPPRFHAIPPRGTKRGTFPAKRG